MLNIHIFQDQKTHLRKLKKSSTPHKLTVICIYFRTNNHILTNTYMFQDQKPHTNYILYFSEPRSTPFFLIYPLSKAYSRVKGP